MTSPAKCGVCRRVFEPKPKAEVYCPECRARLEAKKFRLFPSRFLRSAAGPRNYLRIGKYS